MDERDARSATPAWSDEVYAWLAVAPQIVLTGNINDRHLGRLGDKRYRRLYSTTDVLVDRLRASGYSAVIRWDPVQGMQAAWGRDPLVVRQVVGEDLWDTRDDTSASMLADLIAAVSAHPKLRAALIVEDAPRLAPSRTDPDLHRVYMVAHHQAYRGPRHHLAEDTRQGLYNAVLWLVPSEAELPHWFVGADPVRLVSVPDPGREEREELITDRLPNLDGFEELDEPGRRALSGHIADYTDGLSLNEIATAAQVAIDQSIPIGRFEEAVRFVRSASRTSRWHDPGLRQRIDQAVDELNRAVLGQRRAVRKVADVLARAAIGLSGAHSTSHPTRPQGVLFLAGPTGVGKTEVAKAITKILFGRAESMIRFDMSEFSSEHSEARLIGAPPGYVGHNAGGELTNAVRRRPFCLLLFDEIEKAHPSILDKFLQILEDGRLTDSSGSTVHFTETFIVFTSNLGTSTTPSRPPLRPAVRPGASYEEIEVRVRAAIRREFQSLGRPELLNRIGDNIIVFDFIGPEVAAEILHDALARVTDRIREATGNEVTFGPAAVDGLVELVQQAERLAFGGRSVGSVLESRVLNPLARHLIALDRPARMTVERVTEDTEGAHLELKEEPS
jgi:hypothetical protein